MALIVCKECGKEYSDKATACPLCACPTAYNVKQTTKAEEAPKKTTAVDTEAEPAAPADLPQEAMAEEQKIASAYGITEEEFAAIYKPKPHKPMLIKPLFFSLVGFAGLVLGVVYLLTQPERWLQSVALWVLSLLLIGCSVLFYRRRLRLYAVAYSEFEAYIAKLRALAKEKQENEKN